MCSLAWFPLRGLARTLFVLTASVAAALSTAAATETAKPELQIATGHSRNTSSPMVIPEEKLLFTMDNHGEVKAWDLETGKVLRNWPVKYGALKPIYIRDRGWLLLVTGNGIEVLRAADFSTVANWPLGKIEAPFYEPTTRRFYYLLPSNAGSQFNELDLDTGEATTRVVLPNPPYDRMIGAVPKLWAYEIQALEDGRLLVRFNLEKGLAILDPTNWEQVVRRVDDQRGFMALRPGELLTVTTQHRLDVVDARTFATLRSVEIPAQFRPSQGGYWFAGRTAAKPDRPAQIVAYGYRTVLLLDAQTLQVTKHFNLEKDYPPYPRDVSGLVPLAGDDWILTTWGGANIFRLPEGKFVRSFGMRTLLGTRLAAAPSGFRVMLSSTYNRNSRRIDFTDDGVNVTAFDENPEHTAYSPDGKFVAFYRTGDRAAHVSAAEDFPRKDRVFNRTAKVPLPDTPNFVFSPDNKHLAVLSPMTTHVYELATGRLVFESEAGAYGAHAYSNAGHAVFSPDGKTVAYNLSLKDERGYPSGRVRAIDLATGERKWETRGYFMVLRYAPDGSEVETLDPEQRTVVQLDAATGEIRTRATIPLPGAANVHVSRWKLSADGQRLLAYGLDKFVVCEYPSLRALSLHHMPGYSLESADFFARSDFFVTLNGDNKLRVWKCGQPEPLGTLVVFGNGRDWCFHTPDFQFQGSPDGMREVYFVKGRTVVPLESLFEQFFTPRLPARLFAGEKLQPAVEVAKIKTPPKVTLALETGTRGLVVEDDIPVVKSAEAQVKIAVEATSPQEAIAEVRLYHNGKLVQTTTRGLVVEDDPEARTEKRTFPLTLLPGENTFRAVAVNAQRVESVPAELVVKFAPPAAAGTAQVATGASGETGGGLQLHLVVVGVNKYRNPRFNLNYAVADATAVRDRVQQRATGIFSKINTHTLFDAEVTKAKIVETLRGVATQAGPRDVFLFYYAGHGVMSGEAQPKFYLVPHDVTQMYGADDKLAGTALSSAELQELSRQIPAQKQLFILDACQSAGALDAVATRGAAEQKAIAQLARSSGTHWLTASGSEQFATEFEQLGHGAFTYVLLEGLNGRADSGDGRVSVRELSAFLDSEVPEVTQKHKGTPQFPASYSFGQDFPVGLIAK